MEPFPGRKIALDPALFESIARDILAHANNAGWVKAFTIEHAARDLQRRGYRSGVVTDRVQPYADIRTSVRVYVEPTTSQQPVYVPYVPPPIPVVTREPSVNVPFVPYVPPTIPVVTREPSVNVPVRPFVPYVPPVPIYVETPTPAVPGLVSKTRLPGGAQLPVIIPPSPDFPGKPPPLPIPPTIPGSGNTFLWIAGFLALYLLGKESVSHRSKSKSPRSRPGAGHFSSMGGLAGETANCLAWQEVESSKTGAPIWRCMGYGAACNGKSCKQPTFKFQTRTCVKTKRVPNVSGRSKKKTVQRCAKYSSVCSGTSCLSEPMPKPAPSPGHQMNVNRMIRDMAKQMADDKNADEETAGKALGREIMDRGGIRQFKRGQLKEEFKIIPLFMRRKDGLPLDEMAGEMGFDDDAALLEAIRQEYPGIKKTRRKYHADDFMQNAEGMVWTAIESGQVHGLGQDLFPGLKRGMVLAEQDIATSDDPLEIHLQRKGWDVKRIRQLQDSIAEKAVPDMFTGKKAKLTAGEVELKRDIEEFFEKSRAAASPTKTTKKSRKKTGLSKRDPFWAEQPAQPALLGRAVKYRFPETEFGDSLSTEQIAKGVRKAVKEDGKRQAHGDTGLRAFYITPDLDIVPWRQSKKLKRGVGNAAVHSHSAENWNYLVQLTGKLEPPERFSRKDLEIFRDQLRSEKVDTDVLINGDGRMIIARCDPRTARLKNRQNVQTSLKLPRKWAFEGQYKGMDYYDATRKRQQAFLERAGCEWIETRWKPDGGDQPMLFKTMPRSQEEAIETYMRDPQLTRTRRKLKRGGASTNLDLTKEFWIKVHPDLYPLDPAQQNLFDVRQRIKTATTGEKQITLGPTQTPAQMRLLGELEERDT